MDAVYELKGSVSLLAKLLAAYAVDADDPEIVEAMSNETEIARQIVRVLEQAADAEKFADAIDARIREYETRRDRFKAKHKRLRSIVAQAMQETGLQKIAEPEMTVSMRAGQPELITDIEPQDAPQEFVRTKTTYSIDAKALRDALAHGYICDWARLGNAAPVLTVKVK